MLIYQVISIIYQTVPLNESFQYVIPRGSRDILCLWPNFASRCTELIARELQLEFIKMINDYCAEINMIIVHRYWYNYKIDKDLGN